ncbi:MAG: NAD(P)-dependent oxidoreductase [Candidatus Methanosuratincola petrocarbonis]
MEALVIGSGRVGRRKVFKLVHGGANVTVVTKEIPKGFPDKVKVIIGDGLEYASKNISKFDIVVAATNDPLVNSKISELAIQNKKLVNSVSGLEGCNVAFPAVIDKGSYLVGITTGGRQPSLSKRVKKDLKRALACVESESAP